MQDFLTTEEATKDHFLFISYSHEDQEAMTQWAEYLLNQGVRVWWDKAFMGGDDWESIATHLLAHENCCGILFFCSQDAIKSPNVAKEWRQAAKVKADRAGGDFYPQIIMTGDDPALDYKYLTNFIKKNDDIFSDEDYDDFRDLFGKKDHLYYCTYRDTDLEALLQTIKTRVPEAVDEKAILLDKLADISNADKDMILKLGVHGSNRKPILWRQISQVDTTVTLLCQQVLAEDLGGQQLEQWLNTFKKEAFSPEEQTAVQGALRLLRVEETADLTPADLAADTLWWLADVDGNLQAVVREDGTIYERGYNNKLYKKGIRPVITMDITTLFALVNK